ncbi:MAG: ERAP1-like C-terminal domain-containing protein, partial [Sphingomicrobium sp.]
ATQSRYAFLGTKAPVQSWVIPFCLGSGETKKCMLLDKAETAFSAPESGPLVPNVGGTGYYRFDMPSADWKALIADSANLAPGEAIATTDSLWASFRAGRAPASLLVDEAKAMAANPSSTASVDGGQRLAGLNARGIVPAAAIPAYRKLIDSIYGPRLEAIGFDPSFGAHQADSPEQQQLRQQLVGLVAGEAKDASVRSRLKAAANRYIAGDTKALDPSYLGAALSIAAKDGGLPVARKLVEMGLSSEDPSVRQAALGAASRTGSIATATYLLNLKDKRLRSFDKLGLVGGLAGTDGTSAYTASWILTNYDMLASGNGIFFGSRLPGMLGGQCSAAGADRIEKTLGPKVAKVNVGMLEFQRTIERIRNCGILKSAKMAEVGRAIRGK